MLMKLKPTHPLQTTLATYPEEHSLHKVNLLMLATVIFTLRAWSPGKKTIVV